MALLYLDLDRFKLINDTKGHAVGDLLLKEVAQRLQECLRKSDSLARLGGDEFAIILPDLEEGSEASVIANKILSDLLIPFTLEGIKVHTGTSIGISLSPDDAVDAETLIRKADSAMYRAKEQGGNTFHFFTGEMEVHMQRQMQLDNDLRRSLKREELQLCFQPQWDLQKERIHGMEAVLYWHHPTLGKLPPEKFIPIAEENGMIEPIAEWMLNQVCLQQQQWEQMHNYAARIAVNVFARQFQNARFAETVSSVLNKTGIKPRSLVLELTENILMDDIDTSIEMMQRLNAIGVSLSLDNFGTGYSSLNCLKRLPLSSLKIDKSFVHNISTERSDKILTSVIITLCHELGLEVVGDGVERSEQLAFLKNEHCNIVQGSLISEPLSAAKATLFLSKLRQHPACDSQPAAGTPATSGHPDTSASLRDY